jgi:excinuclease ABC subunit C
MNQDNMNEINQNEDDKNAANMNQDDQDQDEFLDRKEQILNHNSAKNFKEFNIENELKKLPAKPGVYLMHDASDEIIYVGKAIKLCNRVRQYFQRSKKPSAKIEQMVSHVAYFEYIVTDSEMEALILECNLIKKHRPRYNTMLMDDKAYPYIRITVDEDFPRVMLAHKQVRDKSRYFGPYPSGLAVKDTLELVHKLFGIRTCNRVLPRDQGKERPCLNYHIGQCMGPCQGYVTKEEYNKQIDRVISLLNGNYVQLRKELEEKMKAAAAELEFETAAKYRDLAEGITKIAQQQKITDSSSLNDRDVIASAIEGTDAVVQVFFVREGKLIGRDHYHVSVAGGDTEADVLSSFIKQYYAGTPFLPGEIYIPCELEDMEIISSWLSKKRGKKVELLVPKRGRKEKMLELAAQNATIVLRQDKDRIKREEERTTGALKEIEGWLNLPHIYRMEAYDISNTSGMESVGSMVVFEGGKPKRNDYRKFKIRTVQGPNDYASMYEVLTRRFERAIKNKENSHNMSSQEYKATVSQPQSQENSITADSFSRLPDVIMMDGGRGQVNMALEVLDKLGLSIPVCGMVKDDHHRTRGLYYNNVELPIDTHSEGFHLITRVQDEAHRFAIEYHKSLRGKKEIHSILDDIPGIGPKRRLALMRQFGDIYAIREATVAQLADVEGMNERAAEAVYEFFRSSREIT